MICGRCGTGNQAGRRFCRSCGAVLTASCPSCGSTAEPGDRYCGSCGNALAEASAGAGGEQGPAGLGGPTDDAGLTERRLVSVLFADLVGFTALSDDRDPEVVRVFLDRYFAIARERIGRYGGTIEKFIGDAVMAVWGTPVAHEDDAERAVRAALELVDALASLRGPDGIAVVARAAVLTGEAVVALGAAGQGMVAGDLVNTASRLQSVAPPGAVLVGEATVRGSESAIVYEPAGDQLLRGKTAPVPAWRAVRITGSGGSGRMAGGVATFSRQPVLGRSFVGRAAELDQLATALGRCIGDGEPRLATIVGEPGVGKSSLVRRWLGSVGDGAAAPLVWVGRCPAYGLGITYWPLAEVLRDRLGIAENASPEAVRDRLADQPILGLTFGLDAPGELHPMAAQNRLHDAWVTLLSEAAEARPVVLVIEDVHWAEGPLLDLLDRLVRDVDGPLMILTTTRPELARTRPDWVAARRQATTIWLEPLTSDDAGTMIAELLAGDVPAGLREVVVERAEGNPFFVEELLVSFTERGLLARGADVWRFEGVAGPAVVPDSVRSLLAARLDLLPATEKAALQAASVVGRRFDGPAIEELLDGAAPDFDALLERDFIRRLPRDTSGSSRGFAFKHALIREVAYESLTKARRAHLHAAYARRLERVGEGRDEDAAILAHHYAQAVRPTDRELAWSNDPNAVERLAERARSWSLRAAHLAVARYAIEEAISLLEQALALEPTDEERSAIWLAIGRANVLRYDGVGFWTAMEEAIATASSDEARAAIHAELAFETAFRWAIWKRMPTREMVDGWINQTLALAAAGSRARAVGLIASAYWHPLEAGDAPVEALAIAEELGDPALISYAFDARALVAFAAGRDIEAQGWWERRAALADQIRDLDHLEDLYGSAITGNVALGRFAEARRFADLHDHVAMQLSPHHQVHAVAMVVEIEELTGEWATILDLVDRTERAVAANLATPCVRNERTLLSCARAAAELGLDGEADRLEQAADALAMEGYEAVFDPIRVELAIRRGDRDEVRRRLPVTIPPPTKNWFRLTTVIARLDALLALNDYELVEAEAPALLVPGTLLEPFARRALGIARADAELLAAAASRFDELGLTWQAELARAGAIGPQAPASANPSSPGGRGHAATPG